MQQCLSVGILLDLSVLHSFLLGIGQDNFWNEGLMINPMDKAGQGISSRSVPTLKGRESQIIFLGFIAGFGGGALVVIIHPGERNSRFL